MATNSVLIKVLVIYFGINLLLYAGGVRFTDVKDAPVFSSLVNTNNNTSTITDSGIQYSLGGIGGNSPNVNVDSGSTALSFIDVLSSVRGFINFVITMFTGIFVMFLLFPGPIQFFVGVPLAFMALIGMIYFARSGQ